jgi:putative cell wall-binding protein
MSVYASAHRRLTGAFAALVALVTGSLVLAAAPVADAATDVTPARVGGDDRYETAADVAALEYPGGTTEAVIARSDVFPDALAGAGVASTAGGPILLTEVDALPAATAQALSDLGVEHVTLLGGPDAISEDVEDQLAAHYDVDRLAGDTRYETAADMAAFIAFVNGGTVGGWADQRAVFIADGTDFPDALAAGAPAAAQPSAIPILLTTPDSLPGATGSALDDLGIDVAVVLGGPGAVSDTVMAQIEAHGVNAVRVGGTSRQGTAAKLADFAVQYLGLSRASTLVTRGDAFPDALAAGPLGGFVDGPILLTVDSDTLGMASTNWFADSCPSVDVVRAVGGTAAVSINALNEAEKAAESCQSAETDQTYIVAPQEALSGGVNKMFDFRVGARYDGADFTGPVDIALFPCSNVNIGTTSTFAHSDAPTAADDIATGDTGHTTITTVNGVDVANSGHVADVGPAGNGELNWTVSSNAPDCAVIAVFQDGNDNGQLDVDGSGVPTEAFGVGKASWS